MRSRNWATSQFLISLFKATHDGTQGLHVGALYRGCDALVGCVSTAIPFCVCVCVPLPLIDRVMIYPLRHHGKRPAAQSAPLLYHQVSACVRACLCVCVCV